VATSIHHGAPGSFKSFALVQRFGMDALKEGRVVVTNIRGFNDIELIKAQFPTTAFPPTAQIIYIDGETAEGRHYIGGFFHWVPFRALILIDEGQRVYPDRREFKLSVFDTFCCPPGFTPEALPNGISRPEDIYTAFDMQRHYQWDIFVSTTNVAKIQKPIRQVAETAFLHKSLSGKLPFLFKNTWYEFQHDPENNGKTLSNRIGTPHKYKADKRVFKCYQSTATGEHTASKADKNILSDNGVRFKFFFIILSIGLCVYFLFATIENRRKLEIPVSASTTAIQTPGIDSTKFPDQNNQGGVNKTLGNDHSNVPAREDDYFFTLLGFKVLAVAFHDVRDVELKRLTFVVDSPIGLKVVRYSDLVLYGIRASSQSLCSIFLISSGRVLSVGCLHPDIDQCKANIESQYIFSRQFCRKYIKPKALSDQKNVPVATATN
jgi:zona occludens toxin